MRGPELMPNKKGETTAVDLREQIAKILSITDSDTQAFLAIVFELIKRELAAGCPVNIRNFGVFDIKEMRGRVTQVFKHPEKLGNTFTYKKITFRPAEKLKREIYSSKKYKKLRGEEITK